MAPTQDKDAHRKKVKAVTEELQRELTRKEERLHQRERESHRVLYLGVGAAVGLALLVVIIGLVWEFVVRPGQAVATVGDEKVAQRDFGKRVLLEQSEVQSALLFYSQREQQFGNQGIFTQQINQLQATLSSPFALGQQTLDKMIEEIIIKREAAARGITVSDEEVEAALREEVANGQGLVTEPQATETADAIAAATETAAAWTPTPAPTVDVSATVTATATAVVTPTATAAPLPTPVVITDTGYTQGLATLEENIDSLSGISLAEYKEIVRTRLLAEKLSKVIGEEEVAATEEQVKASHILVREIEPTPTATAVPEGAPTPEPTATATALPADAPTPTATPAPRTRDDALALAAEIRRQLVDGADFAALAARYSDDLSNKDNGGELGWFGQGEMVPEFDAAAFALPVGEISEPISTTFGVHLIKVEEKDPERAKDEQTLNSERSQAFRTWLEEQIAAANVVRNDMMGSLPLSLR